MQQQDQTVYRIGDQSFENLPRLLTFYTLHYLDTTPLKRPAQKKAEKVIGKFDFVGSVSLSQMTFEDYHSFLQSHVLTGSRRPALSTRRSTNHNSKGWGSMVDCPKFGGSSGTNPCALCAACKFTTIYYKQGHLVFDDDVIVYK